MAAQLGNLLLCDLSRLWNPGYADGAFVYVNDAGFDADDRDYEAFPVGGPDTGTTRIGPLLFVADQKPDLLGPDQPGWSPFALALRRSGTTYLSPLDGGMRAPRSRPGRGRSIEGGKGGGEVASPEGERVDVAL